MSDEQHGATREGGDTPAEAGGTPDDATQARAAAGGEPDGEETRVGPGGGEPDGEETEVRPGAGEPPGEETTSPGELEVTSVAAPNEPPTQVLSGEGATRVMATPPGAPATPPPLGGTPAEARDVRFAAAGEGGGRRRPPRIVWFALIGIAAGLALAAAFVLLTRGPDVEPFVGTWGPTTDSLGPLGGLFIEDRGDEIAVTVYSPDVVEVATVAASWEGDDLVAALADAGALVEQAGPATLRIAHDEDDDHLVVTLQAGDASAVQRLARVSALGPGPAEGSPAPAATTTPTQAPTATPTATASPGTSPEPTTSPDAEVRAGITSIQVGVLTWASDHGGLFPPVSAVSSDGEVGALVDPWPTNPFSAAPMRPGSAPGDYTYEQLDAGRAYRLTGYLGDGSTVVVP